MRLLVIVSEEVHAEALREARRVGKERPLPSYVLNAPLDTDATSWLNRIWDEVEGALRRAYREGIEAARPVIETVSTSMTEMVAKMGSRAEQVRTVISERLNAYLQLSIDGALERVRATMKVGGREMTMVSVTVQQKINLSGSLKASLNEICSFVAAGEISLSAEYEFKESTPVLKHGTSASP